MRVLRILFTVVCWLLMLLPVRAQEREAAVTEYAAPRYGAALLVGSVYNPEEIGLVIVQGQMLVDYGSIFWHRAPEGLKLKFELNAGLTTTGRRRGLLAVNMLALRYLDKYGSGRWTPYIEAGIGLIYTDFRVEGQGLRFNFNPQLGAGLEYDLSDTRAMTFSLRLHHISNGNIYKENRGLNSALLQIGYLF